MAPPGGARPPPRARSVHNIGRGEHDDLREEIMHLKRNVVAMTNENKILNSKVRRLETENKKLKESGEFGSEGSAGTGLDKRNIRVLSAQNNSNPANAGLGQKIYRLEQCVKDKDSTINQLKSDVKTTRIDDIKAQMEQYYQEVVRLQHALTSQHSDSTGLPKELATRMKTMNDRILKLAAEKSALQEQLEKSGKDDFKPGDYEDYNQLPKRDLLKIIARLEQGSQSGPAKSTKSISKQQAKQMDLIHTENDKLKGLVSKLKDEKKTLKHDLKSDKVSGSGKHSRRSSEQLPSGTKRKLRKIRENQAARTIQHWWKENKEHEINSDSETDSQAESDIATSSKKQSKSIKKSSRKSSAVNSDSEPSSRDDSGIEEAATAIQAAVRGHNTRKDYLSKSQVRSRSHSRKNSEAEESDFDY